MFRKGRYPKKYGFVISSETQVLYVGAGNVKQYPALLTVNDRWECQHLAQGQLVGKF